MAAILVTGAAGFIGSAYVRNALTGAYPAQTDLSITVFDSLTLTGDHASLLPVAADPRLKIVVGDVCDGDAVDAAAFGHDTIVHFAAESHVDTSITSPARFAGTNLLGTQTLLDAARRHNIGRFVLVSTDEVYGSIDAGTADETAPLAPSSPYAASKAGAELLALAAHRTYGLEVVVTRGANTYGPYQYPEKIIPLFLARLLRGERVPLYGDGLHTRSWLHVDDHCRAIEAARVRGGAGRAYNLAGTADLTNRALTGMLLRAFGAGDDRIEPTPDRPGHDRRYALDDTRARTELGWAPSVDFAEGLAGTVAWYRAHESWWSRFLP
ncbi:MAG TPA: dTDP-glucose 4,6-dehydratase [Micromonosporaceae bacterium]